MELLAVLAVAAWLTAGRFDSTAPVRAGLSGAVRTPFLVAGRTARERWAVRAAERAARTARRRSRWNKTRTGRAALGIEGFLAALGRGLAVAVPAAWAGLTSTRAGFADAYRAERDRRRNHPDPIKEPEETWREVFPYLPGRVAEHLGLVRGTDPEHPDRPEHTPVCCGCTGCGRAKATWVDPETGDAWCAWCRGLSPTLRRRLDPAGGVLVKEEEASGVGGGAGTSSGGGARETSSSHPSPSTPPGAEPTTTTRPQEDTTVTQPTTGAGLDEITDLDSLDTALSDLEGVARESALTASGAVQSARLADVTALPFKPGDRVTSALIAVAETAPRDFDHDAWLQSIVSARAELAAVRQAAGELTSAGVSGHTDQLAPH